MGKKINSFFPPILFLLITLLLFGKTLLPQHNQIISAGDIKHIYYPYREFVRDSIFSGEIPYWNPFLFSGTPFIAHPYTQFFYPTTLLFLFLPSNIYISFLFAFHLFLAGIFMYLALKKFTDSHSAILGGIIYAFNGYFVSRIYAGHVDYVISSAFLPIIFLKAYEYIQEKSIKSLVLGGLFLCLQIFTGLLSMTFNIILIVAIFNLFVGRLSTNKILHKFKYLVVFFVLGFALSAVYVIPAYQFISKTVRGTGLPYNQASFGSATLQTLFMFVNPEYLGSDFNKKNPFHGPPPDYVAHLYFIGIIPIIILCLGLIYIFIKQVFYYKSISSLNNKLLVLSSITIISIILSLGPSSPINLHFVLWKILSIYKTTRLPARHLINVVFTLSLMTGIILQTLKSKTIKKVLIVLVVIETLSFGKKFIFLSKLPDLLPENDKILNSLIKEKGPIRLLPDFTLNSPVREQISFAAPLIYKYYSTSGYTPAILTTYYDFIDRINGNYTRSIDKYNSEIVPSFPYLSGISFLNVKYIIVDKTADFLSDKKENYVLMQDTALYRIYKNNKYLPRFFFVTQTKVYDTDVKFIDGAIKDQHDFAKLITVKIDDAKKIKHPSNCNNNTSADIEVREYKLNIIRLRVNTPCNGFISTSEVYYPGWTAKIDNKPTEIILSNTSFRAINVPQGEHTITLTYQPTIYYLSGVVTLFSLLFCIYLWLSDKQFDNN